MKLLDRKFDILDILMIISIVFIGSDIWGFEFSGLNIRFIQVFYVFFVFVLILRKKYCIFSKKSILIFMAFFLITCLLSVNFTSSISFMIWLIYNLFFIVFLFYSYIRDKGSDKFLEIFRISMWIVFFFCFVSFALGFLFKYEFPFFTYQEHKGIIRTALWFYEPSYLTTFLTIWLGVSAYCLVSKKGIKYLFDVAGAILAIFSTTSTTGFIAIALIIVFIYLTLLIRARSIETRLQYIFVGILVCGIGFGVLYYFFPNIYDTFVIRVFRDGFSASSGNRMENYSVAFDMFKENPLLGVGPNCYGYVLGDSEIQATNVTLELMATIGFVGMVLFYVMYFTPIVKSIGKKGSNEAAFAFAAFFLIVILQANQNYMRLYLWMMIGIVYGCLAYRKEDKYLYINY